MVVVSHEFSLFICIWVSQDVTILRHSDFYRRCRAHVTHNDKYFECLIGDPNYIAENIFIMYKFGNVERPLHMDEGALPTYNKMHVGYHVRV